MTDQEVRNRAAEVLRRLAIWERQGTPCLAIRANVFPLLVPWDSDNLEEMAKRLEGPPVRQMQGHLLKEAAALLRKWPVNDPRWEPAAALAKKLLQEAGGVSPTAE